MGELRAGAATADMTPAAGTPLAGFWSPRPASGVETPLAAHALVLDDGARRLGLVGLDLIALPAEHVDKAAAGIRRRTGIAPGDLFVACSHTHDAPYPCPLLGAATGADPAYMVRVTNAIVESVSLAADAAAPAEAGFAAGDVPGLTENRRRLRAEGDVWNRWMLPRGQDAPPAGPVDDQLVALWVRARSGGPLAVLWNFALHAHLFACGRVSADYPYHVGERVRAALGPGVVSVFTAGACGDINLRPGVEPRRVADDLAGGLLRLWESAAFSPRAGLGARRVALDLDVRDAGAFQEEEIRRKQPASLDVCRQEWEVLRAAGGGPVRTSVSAAAVGDFALAAVPGEYFCALGLEVKRRSPFAPTAVAELTNDYVGYVPTDEAYDQGGYELFLARSSRLARGGGERIAEELAGLLGSLHAGQEKDETR